MAGVKVFLDQEKVKERIKEAADFATFAMAEQALTDCNYYCKQQSGELQRSAVRASDLKKGLLVWNTKYARRQYYLDATNNGDGDPNHNATKMWCNKARAEHGEEWKKIGQEALKKKV